MRDGRTFRMRIVVQRMLDVEVYVAKGRTQEDAERMLEQNYDDLRRDEALMRVISEGPADVSQVRSVTEVVNRG